ncbi:MAG: tyrosine-type recombinase/integrase [Alphaproteobacteria bacterium]
MALSDAGIRSAKARPKQYKLYDEGGLFLIVKPSGGKLWRFKYRHMGKEQQLSLGTFPDVGLKEARKRRDEARAQMARGLNPAFEKKREAAVLSVSATNTFKAVADELIAKREQEGLKEITTGKARWLLSQLEPATLWALQLAPHVFVRPGELRQAEWSEIDLDAAVGRIPGARMKMNREHVVPLSTQAVAILKTAGELTGDGRYVFPSVRTSRRPMSENTLNAALRRMGYTSDDMTSHGFRSTASALLNESGKWSVDAIERALAHGDTDSVRAAYHRGAHWDERVKMAQWWSDHLDMLREGGRVIKLGARG